MDLASYRKTYCVKYASIAAACGVTPQRISQVANDHYKPSWRLAGAIERATDGKVERAQWFPDDVHCGVTSPSSSPASDPSRAPVRRQGRSATLRDQHAQHGAIGSVNSERAQHDASGSVAKQTTRPGEAP